MTMCSYVLPALVHRNEPRSFDQKPLLSLHMAHNTILNTSRPGIFVKLATAQAWVEQCACDWVVLGKSIRELSATERLDRISRNLALGLTINHSDYVSKSSDPLEPKEIEDVIEKMPRSSVWTPAIKFEVLGRAREFYREAIQ